MAAHRLVTPSSRACRRLRPTATRRRSPAGVQPGDRNFLSDLGEKIFLDRYALKDMNKAQPARRRPGGRVRRTPTRASAKSARCRRSDGGEVTVVLSDGEIVSRALEHVDTPTGDAPGPDAGPCGARHRRGGGAREARAEWEANFRWLLDDWKFVPGGRILDRRAAPSQELTYYNCYVIPSPHDSRDGIIGTLSQMTEIMSRGRRRGHQPVQPAAAPRLRARRQRPLERLGLVGRALSASSPA